MTEPAHERGSPVENGEDLNDVTLLSEDQAEPTFYLSREGEVYGPHTVADVQAWWGAHYLSADSLIWTPGMEDWTTLGAVFDLTPAEESMPTAEQSDIPDDLDDVPDEVPAFIEDSLADGLADAPLDDRPALMPWTGDPAASVARMPADRASRRLSVATATAIFLHLGLLAGAIWAAPVLFEAVLSSPPVPPLEPPPLEVAFVPEEAPPPPSAPPETEQETAPPPPLLPPLPPAPIDTPVPVAPPADPMPQPALPQPEMEAPPPLPLPAPMVKVAHKPRVRPVVNEAPTTSVPQVTDAGPSDYLYAPVPHYPRAAEQMRQQGTVILLVRIDDAVNPESVQISQSSGFAVLDEAARKQVADTYRFKVGNAHALRVPIAFQLSP